MKPDWYPVLRGLTLTALRSRPQGISEYDLILDVREQDQGGLLPSSFAKNLDLFRSHFMVFHTLYRLRDELWANEEAHLEISPLCVRLMPYVEGEAALTIADPLREYYLDLEELEATCSEEVDDMLASFWNRLARDDLRQDALEELGLVDPVDDATIKKRYRELAMKHHPDRGGDKEKLQSINVAMAKLAGKGI